MHIHPSNRHAFTLIDLILTAVLIAIFSILFLFMFMPALGIYPGHRRGSGSANAHSQSNLRSLTTGAMNYAGDHNDRIFSYTWNAGQEYITLYSGRPKAIPDSRSAAALQAENILQRATGRIGSEDTKHYGPRITPPVKQLMHLRYSHIVLLDYLTDRQPEPIAASPFDKNLYDWQENPLAYLDKENPFPYGSGFPTEAGYDMDPTWTDPAVMQLWPFGSSYQVVPHAWLNDTDPQYTPSPNSPHHMILQAEEDTPLGGRKMTEVAHPSAKVFMYEEFDYQTESTPLYASDPNAKMTLAFFDGSVRQERIKAANSAQDQSDPTRIWQQPYLPLDTFPIPRAGLGDTTPLDLRFRWTKGGLAGVDFEP